MTQFVTTRGEDELVLAVLSSAGPRGASNEDFVEAGLAGGYVAALRRLVDERGLDIRIDFATGAARWALIPAEEPVRRAA